MWVTVQVGVDREGVVFDQIKKEKEDHAVEELLAGYVPLLVRCDADSESHHKHSAADKRDAGEDTQNERETEDGFEKRDSVAEAEGEAVRQSRLREMFGSGCSEGANAVVDADETVTSEVDAEGDAEERVGEGLVIHLHAE